MLLLLLCPSRPNRNILERPHGCSQSPITRLCRPPQPWCFTFHNALSSILDYTTLKWSDASAFSLRGLILQHRLLCGMIPSFAPDLTAHWSLKPWTSPPWHILVMQMPYSEADITLGGTHAKKQEGCGTGRWGYLRSQVLRESAANSQKEDILCHNRCRKVNYQSSG